MKKKIIILSVVASVIAVVLIALLFPDGLLQTIWN